MPTLIKLENVWKIYQLGKTEVNSLRGVNLEIESGDFATIMGPSGSGKSTLLNMIGLLDIPTKGRLFLKEKDVTKYTESELALLRGRTIGFVFQEFNLLNHLRAWENVELPMIFQGTPQAKRRARAMELLEKVGMENRAQHQLAELSGGERQRVAIARAFANNPELVIADEPTGDLDSVSAGEIIALMHDLNKRLAITFVVATHNLALCEKADRVIEIKDGILHA